MALFHVLIQHLLFILEVESAQLLWSLCPIYPGFPQYLRLHPVPYSQYLSRTVLLGSLKVHFFCIWAYNSSAVSCIFIQLRPWMVLSWFSRSWKVYFSFSSFPSFTHFDFPHSLILLCHYPPTVMVSKTNYHNKEEYLLSHRVASDLCELLLLLLIRFVLTDLFWGCLWKLKSLYTYVRVSSQFI